MFKHPTSATEKKTWGKSQLPSPCFVPGEICALRSFWLKTPSRKYGRSLAALLQQPAGHTGGTSPQSQQRGREVQTSHREVSRDRPREPTLYMASLPSGEQGSGSCPKPTQSLERKLSVHPASDECKHSRCTCDAKENNIHSLHGFKSTLASLCRFYELMPEINLVPAALAVSWTVV